MADFLTAFIQGYLGSQSSIQW